MAAPAVHAAETSADASIVVPDEPDDDSFTAGVPSASEDSEARAIFQAWKRLDTGLTASIGVAVPSRRPIDQMSLSSSYGMRVHPRRPARSRATTASTSRRRAVPPIYATADGIVGRAQRLGGYGNYVEVERGNAIQTRYGHMSSYVVTPGQSVKKGDILGFVGSTGRSTGNHLHYEVRIEGAPVNPMPFVRSDQMAIAAITGKNVAMGGPE